MKILKPKEYILKSLIKSLIEMQKKYRTYESAATKCPKGSYVIKNDNGSGFIIKRFPKTPKSTWPPGILDSWKKQN